MLLLVLKSNVFFFLFVTRNYHVFYYLLAGASEEERSAFHLKQPEEYHYLNQVGPSAGTQCTVFPLLLLTVNDNKKTTWSRKNGLS